MIVSCAVPLFPSADPVIVVLPGPAVVTRPLEEIVATAVFAEDHAMGRPLSTTFWALYVTAVNCALRPWGS